MNGGTSYASDRRTMDDASAGQRALALVPRIRTLKCQEILAWALFSDATDLDVNTTAFDGALSTGATSGAARTAELLLHARAYPTRCDMLRTFEGASILARLRAELRAIELMQKIDRTDDEDTILSAIIDEEMAEEYTYVALAGKPATATPTQHSAAVPIVFAVPPSTAPNSAARPRAALLEDARTYFAAVPGDVAQTRATLLASPGFLGAFIGHSNGEDPREPEVALQLFHAFHALEHVMLNIVDHEGVTVRAAVAIAETRTADRKLPVSGTDCAVATSVRVHDSGTYPMANASNTEAQMDTYQANIETALDAFVLGDACSRAMNALRVKRGILSLDEDEAEAMDDPDVEGSMHVRAVCMLGVRFVDGTLSDVEVEYVHDHSSSSFTTTPYTVPHYMPTEKARILSGRQLL